MLALYHGLYATRIYLPFSTLSRQLRSFTRRARGRKNLRAQTTRLPQVPWTRCTATRLPRVWEPGKANGNVRISELGILSALAAECADGTRLFEIGTFDGRTTLNLAMNCPAGCEVHTLDLPPDVETRYAIAEGERHMVEKTRSGVRYESYRSTHPAVVGKIHQWLGDSAAFDYTPFVGTCSLFFVDGSHAYDYALSDTRAAMLLARPGGVIVWHDYGVWEGVTRALEELEEREHLGLRHISGTSLVYWKKPSA